MSTQTGIAAEAAAARYLQRRGHEVLERNWRTRFCEIDLITRSPAGIHIVEVKYRAGRGSGSAAEYVTQEKRLRVARGAESWAVETGYDGPLQLDVIAVDGPADAATITYLPDAF